MKLVTTFAALELLGRDYRWRTEAFLGGPLVDGTLRGDLILRGTGDPKITIEQWQAFMADLRRDGTRAHRRATSCSTAATSGCRRTTPSPFDAEPLRPYNVGPDAMLVNFKTVKFAFAPGARPAMPWT